MKPVALASYWQALLDSFWQVPVLQATYWQVHSSSKKTKSRLAIHESMGGREEMEWGQQAGDGRSLDHRVTKIAARKSPPKPLSYFVWND